MTERMQNTASSYIGSIKQTIGQTLGYPDMAADGAAQKEQAETNQQVADAKTQLHGVGHNLQGQVEQAVGTMTKDPVMEARGKANQTKGEMEQRQGQPSNHILSGTHTENTTANKETQENKPLS
ncbi:hypothetical protein BGZ83_009433 [Gryganskiella cystojenkinii]|nr:hypothetical protein BGZ83_009433 [Gryganskiella cystojenkinii]